MVSFNIVIPNYNNSEWLGAMFSSIYSQTYSVYDVIFVDDCSTDKSLDIAMEWRDKFENMDGKDIDFDIIVNTKKRWNGGSRNAARDSYIWSCNRYTLYLDSDDWFADASCLEEIAKVIELGGYPDLVRLSYYTLIGDQLSHVNLGDQDSVAKIVHDPNVACWTKCIKTDKIVPFPENTLMEDVVQHIQQLDVIDSVEALDKGIVVWNRNNRNSCSRDITLQNGKWRSSLYRHYAELLDMRVRREECQIELERRRAIALDNIKNDRFEQ